MNTLKEQADEVMSRMSSWDCANALNGDTGTIEYLAEQCFGTDALPSETLCGYVVRRLEEQRFDSEPFASRIDELRESAAMIKHGANDVDESFTKGEVLMHLDALIRECDTLKRLAAELIASIEL